MDKEILRKLKLFHSQAQSLKEKDIFFSNISVTINWEKEKGLSVETKKPNDELLESTLLRFRPFVSKGEEINFDSICNLLDKNLEKSSKEKVRKTRENWNKVLQTKQRFNPLSGLKFVLNGKELKGRDILKLWLNGKYFHPSGSKKETYKELELVKISPYEQLIFMSFIDIVQQLSMLVIWLDFNVVVKILDKYK